MEAKIEVDESTDKLPHKMYDLSVAGNLKATLEKLVSVGVKIKSLREKRVPKGHLKCRMIKGRPYWYRVFKVKVDGKWRNKETYLGTRKPRE